jgi:outer membrane translocation and assembly module TamA
MDVDLAPKKKLNLFKGGVGYDTLMGARFQLYYERRNFMGNARKLTGMLQYARKSQLAEVNYFSPAVLKLGSNYLDFYDKLGYRHNAYQAYTADKAYFDLALKYERDALKATVGLGFEAIRIAQTGHEALPGLIPGNFLMLYPYLQLVLDQRDSKINPKNGYYLSAYSEYGLGFKKENSRYLKLLFEGRYIKSFGDLTLATVAKAGFIDTAYGQLPASKLFYAGGAYSNRAYGERQIGTVLSPVASSALGGKTWLNLSLEANYPIYDKLDGAIFFDSTMISDKEYDFKGKRIDSVGVGLRYLTPIGPIKVDVGVNIHDRHQYGFSFQIGQSF